MVTNGNLTGLTERLVKEKLVSRSVSPNDRRTQLVRLTANGKRALQEMAADHRSWIQSMFAGLDSKEISTLYRLIGRLKESVQSVSGTATEADTAEETHR
jgi:DNA-binding MarR family transcriptional regulator